MNQNDVIDFFDRLAPEWDSGIVKDSKIINTILDNAGVKSGCDVLDVACGTGVLISDYLDRNVHSVTGIDISPQMLKIAKQKFPQAEFICADAEKTEFGKKFDCIMIFNAFPHFSKPESLIRHLSKFLKPGGTLTVAHDMSRDGINKHHEGTANKVSIGLPTSDELAEIFSKYTEVTVNISDENMYQLTGIMSDIKRCKWVNLNNPLYISYHDNEWGKPSYDDSYMFEMLILESFQAGLSWECVLNKREAFRREFDGFDYKKIANYTEDKQNELACCKDIIRNKRKIKAAVNNAKIFMDIQREWGTFSEYIWHFTNGMQIINRDNIPRTTSDLSDEISADLKNRGMNFVGSTIIYSYLQAIGIIDDHETDCDLSY